MTGDDNQLFDPTRFGAPKTTQGPPSGTDIEPGERLVRVLPDISGLSREFDYRCPAKWADDIAIGSLVRFDLNGRRVAGWVTAIDVAPVADMALASLTRLSSIGPPDDVIDLARWAAHRWHGRMAPILKAASPPRMISIRPLIRSGPSAPRASAPTLAADGTTTQAKNDDQSDWLSDAALRAGDGSVLAAQGSPMSKTGWLISSLAQLGSVLVVEPDVGRASWLAGGLSRAGIRTNSHPQQWAGGFSGGVVVGSRSAVWAPVSNLQAIIVLDEHDESLQEERVPTWHARDVAIERARREGARCVLLSPTPSLAALNAADQVAIAPRAEMRRGWPVVERVDRRQDELGFNSLFSSRLVEVLRSADRAVLVLNRKGRARLLACATCGELVRSEDGEHTMIEDEGGLLAPATGERRPLVCASCGGTTLKRLRLGVGRAVEELTKMLGRSVVEVSSDKQPGIGDGNKSVFLGTEAALRAVDRCDVVAFLDFDQELLAPRYRAGEQAMALLARAARLVGGRRDASRLIVQTRIPDHVVLQAAAGADPTLFSEPEERSRLAMGWPPYGALAEISGQGADPMASALMAAIDEEPALGERAMVLGPRHDGRYLISVRPEEGEQTSQGEAGRWSGSPPAVLAELLAAVPRPRERLRVVVDPPRA